MAEISKSANVGDTLSKLDQQFGARPEKQREVKKNLDKDDFLKIMITQMKNQDPTNPLKPEQFAAQLAQFTSVEQLANISKGVNHLSQKSGPEDRMGLVSLLGKSVTVDRNRFLHEENKVSEVNFDVPVGTHSLKLTVIAPNGEKVHEKSMSSVAPGKQSIAWNGMNSQGAPSPSGNYQVKIEALNDRGGTLKVNSLEQSTVQGVSFDGPEPVLFVGDVNKPTRISMNQIIRIDQTKPDAPISVNTENNTPLLNTHNLNNINTTERR